MSDLSRLSPGSRGAAPNIRARKLVLALAAIGLLCGIMALVTNGKARTGFGATALILLLTAVYCAFAAWFESPAAEISDTDAPPPPVQLPQSPVTQICDPPVPPNKLLERTRAG